jgi:hypothetical protein
MHKSKEEKSLNLIEVTFLGKYKKNKNENVKKKLNIYIFDVKIDGIN